MLQTARKIRLKLERVIWKIQKEIRGANGFCNIYLDKVLLKLFKTSLWCIKSTEVLRNHYNTETDDTVEIRV